MTVPQGRIVRPSYPKPIVFARVKVISVHPLPRLNSYIPDDSRPPTVRLPDRRPSTSLLQSRPSRGPRGVGDETDGLCTPGTSSHWVSHWVMSLSSPCSDPAGPDVDGTWVVGYGGPATPVRTQTTHASTLLRHPRSDASSLRSTSPRRYARTSDGGTTHGSAGGTGSREVQGSPGKDRPSSERGRDTALGNESTRFVPTPRGSRLSSSSSHWDATLCPSRLAHRDGGERVQ